MAERQTIGDEPFDVLVDVDDGGGGYEWAHAALLRRVRDGQLYLFTENGCSCNAPWDYPNSADLDAAVPSWQEAVELLKGQCRPYLFTDDDVARFAQELMELRPASSEQARRPVL